MRNRPAGTAARADLMRLFARNSIEVGKMEQYVISPVIPQRAHLGSETQFSRRHDLRRARAGALRGKERRSVVGAVDLTLGSEAGKHCRSGLIQFGALGIGEEFLVSIFGRTLQWRVKFVRPNAL
jgi:hypothetical protein